MFLMWMTVSTMNKTISGIVGVHAVPHGDTATVLFRRELFTHGLGVGCSVACSELFCSVSRIAAESQPPTWSICLRAKGGPQSLLVSLSFPQCYCFCSQYCLCWHTSHLKVYFYCNSLSIALIYFYFFAFPLAVLSKFPLSTFMIQPIFLCFMQPSTDSMISA